MRKLPTVIGSILLVGLRTASVLALVVLAIAAVLWQGYRERALKFDLASLGRFSQRSVVYDSTGEVYARIHGENRTFIPLSRVPPHFIDALLAREDSRFWRHCGIDFIGIARACLENLKEGAVRQGGSTLTQQLARNTYQLKARTLDRKLLEATLALRIEQAFGKRQILEWYLNRIYFGAGTYGLQAAAWVYYGKPADRLTLPECAMLAGLIRGPNRFSPLSNPGGALGQRDKVLERMSALGMLTVEEAALAIQTPLERPEAAAARQRLHEQGYVIDAVRRDLASIVSRQLFDRGGLRIHITIDPRLQTLAEECVTRRTAEIEARPGWRHPRKADYVSPALSDPGDPGDPGDPSVLPTPPPSGEKTKYIPYLQGALIAIDNRSGAIRALVGGRDYAQSPFDRAIMARRQAGSTFKPFVYATAFQSGLFPNSFVTDARIRRREFRDLPRGWSPENADGEYGGMQAVSFGLIHSRNTMSVRVGEFATLKAVLRTAALAGLGDDTRPYPAIFLGGFDTTLEKVAAAYTAFPNGGRRMQSHLISRIEDAEGNLVYRSPHVPVQAMSRAAASETNDLMEQVLKAGTGAQAAKLGLTKPAAGKTGTSNDCHDAWFVGYTSSLTCGVWLGFDRPQRIMKKGYGGALALPIWVDFMQSAPEEAYPARSLTIPVRRVRVMLCAQSNKLATEACKTAQTSYMAEIPADLAPATRCTVHQDLMAVQPEVPTPFSLPSTVPTGAASLASPVPGPQVGSSHGFRDGREAVVGAPVSARPGPGGHLQPQMPVVPSAPVTAATPSPQFQARPGAASAPPGSTVIYTRIGPRIIRTVRRGGQTLEMASPPPPSAAERDRGGRYLDGVPVRRAIPVR